MGKSKLYVVAQGKTPGVYTAWAGVGQAQEQVQGYPGAVYKSFPTAGQAIAWLETVPHRSSVMEALEKMPAGTAPKKRSGSSSGTAFEGHEKELAAGKAVFFTDGGCLGNP